MKIEKKSCIYFGITCFLIYLAIHYWDALAGFSGMLASAAGSLLLGCVMAYMINILMSLYEKYYFPRAKKHQQLVDKTRRPICMVGAMVSLFAAVVMIIGIIVPELYACVELLLEEIPNAIGRLVEWMNESETAAAIIPEDLSQMLADSDWEAKLQQLVTVLLAGVGGAAQLAISVVSSFISVAMELMIGLIFAIYLLSGKETLAQQFGRLMNRYLKPSHISKIRYFLATADICFHKFIVGQCVEAVILGGLCMLGMLLLQLPYAVMVGTLIGFTALIPVAGAYIGGAVGAFMIFTVSPVKALIFLVFLCILQQIEGNVIYPRVVGTSIGLPGIWVLAAVTIGGAVMGVVGMLVGVPIAATIYQLIRADVRSAEKKLCLSAASEETGTIRESQNE